MPNSNWRTLTVVDTEVIARLRRLWDSQGHPKGHSLTLSIAEGSGSNVVNSTLSAIEEHPVLAVLAGATQPVLRSLSLNVTEGRPFFLSINREHNSSYPGTDAVNVNIADGLAAQDTASILLAMRVAMPVHAAGSEALEVALGPHLGDFYRRREESVSRVEQALVKLVEQSVSARAELDKRLDTERRQLLADADAERQKAHSVLEAQRAQLDEQREALRLREGALDDRTNTHARREIRRELKDKFEERGRKFSLTPETGEKRKQVQRAFWALGGFTFVLASINLWEAVSIFEENTTPGWWLTTVAARGLLSALAFIGSVVYYIRWADSWSERHASEEFKLRRLELDMDRASWLVEMALEWKDEKGSQIPPELLMQLSHNLFSIENDLARVQHPAEDLAATLLGSASSLRVALPGGDATFDRKALKQIGEQAKKTD